MKIKDRLSENRVNISFEVIYPRKTDAGYGKVFGSNRRDCGFKAFLYQCDLWSRRRDKQEYSQDCISYPE